MFSQRYRIFLFLATILLIPSTFAGGSRVSALKRVHHGTIVSGDPAPLAKAAGKPVVLYY